MTVDWIRSREDERSGKQEQGAAAAEVAMCCCSCMTEDREEKSDESSCSGLQRSNLRRVTKQSQPYANL